MDNNIKVYTNPDPFDFLHIFNSFQMEYYDKNDVDVLIREINISIILGDIDITPKLSNIKREDIEICQKLCKEGAVIGGSLLLKSCGLLDRDTDDIDVFWSLDKAIEKGIVLNDNRINSSDDYIQDTQDPDRKYQKRIKVKSEEYGVLDIFNITEDVWYEVDGIKFKNPIKTLREKFKYSREKDVIDFYYIKSIIN